MAKKTGVKRQVKKQESPRKTEVALLKDAGCMSPLGGSRKAAERAKKALSSNKAGGKVNDFKSN